jgi:hypothetical protein
MSYANPLQSASGFSTLVVFPPLSPSSQDFAKGFHSSLSRAEIPITYEHKQLKLPFSLFLLGVVFGKMP